jgi:hypothetical protein
MKLDKEVMIRSYNNISFSPERRGEQDFNYYTELLADDLKLLAERGSVGNYETKFIQRVMLIYYRQARCASVMITGAGNFQFRQNNKRNESQRRAETDFAHWRTKYIKSLFREKTLSPEAEIDETLASIDRLETMKELSKQCAKLKTEEERKAFMAEHGIERFIYNLTTKIRERKKKLEVMKVRIERKETFETINFDGGSISIEADRVIISHLTKPERDVIDKLKSRGFRWSPSFKAWSRKHTGNAIYDAKNIIGIT